MNPIADVGPVRRPRPITTGTALLGSVAALVSLALPWWSAAGRSATPTANGLFPTLTMSLVVLAVVGVDVAVRMLRNSGTAPHALIAVAVAFLAVVGISFHVLAGWGEATRGYGQVAALVAVTLVLTTTALGLGSPGSSRPAHPPVAVGFPVMPQQPPVPVMPQQPPVPVMPQQPPASPSDSFWFHVGNTEPLIGPDGVNAISLLQPGRWYLAVGLVPGWVVAQDENGQTGYVHPEQIVRAAQ